MGNLVCRLATKGQFVKGGKRRRRGYVKEEKRDKNRKGKQAVARANSVSVGTHSCSPDVVKRDHLDIDSIRIGIDDVKFKVKMLLSQPKH